MDGAASQPHGTKQVDLGPPEAVRASTLSATAEELRSEANLGYTNLGAGTKDCTRPVLDKVLQFDQRSLARIPKPPRCANTSLEWMPPYIDPALS